MKKSSSIVKTDKQIVDAVMSGQRKGLNLMVSLYGQKIFGIVVRIIGNVMDAEELTQDTFLRVFRCMSSYDPQRASLGTWLCRIAYRLTLDFLKRRHQVFVSIEDTEVWQTDISNEQLEAELSTGNDERINRLAELIEDLAPDERLLLMLYYFEERPLDECSYIMDASPHALANRLYRLRKKLYKQLQNI